MPVLVESFASRLKSRRHTLFGTWLKLPSLEVVELLAHAGFDYLVVDLEHAPLTLEFAYSACVVAQGLGLGVLARVPDQSGSHVQRLLDSGYDGLLVPRVADAEAAARAVSGMVFEPAGRRGLGITSRAGRWGLDTVATYTRRSSDILRAIQLEDRAAIAAMAEIAATPHLDAAFLGLGDLQLSTGLPPTHPDMAALIDAAIAACHARNLPIGTAIGTAEAARAAQARGFDFVMVSNDAGLLGNAATGLMRAVRG